MSGYYHPLRSQGGEGEVGFAAGLSHRRGVVAIYRFDGSGSVTLHYDLSFLLYPFAFATLLYSYPHSMDKGGPLQSRITSLGVDPTHARKAESDDESFSQSKMAAPFLSILESFLGFFFFFFWWVGVGVDA